TAASSNFKFPKTNRLGDAFRRQDLTLIRCEKRRFQLPSRLQIGGVVEGYPLRPAISMARLTLSTLEVSSGMPSFISEATVSTQSSPVSYSFLHMKLQIS
ncbi:MAG: hypothetical protein QXO32_05890, partial [Candidatus Bathyarchaeia archaeon]